MAKRYPRWGFRYGQSRTRDLLLKPTNSTTTSSQRNATTIMGETSPTTSLANVVFAPKQTDVNARQASARAAVRPGTSDSPARAVMSQYASDVTWVQPEQYPHGIDRRALCSAQMKELMLPERLDLLTAAAARDAVPITSHSDPGEAICRACLGAFQILDARPDGDWVRLQQEPPAADYRAIWTRLNRQWRVARAI